MKIIVPAREAKSRANGLRLMFGVNVPASKPQNGLVTLIVSL